MTHMTHKESTCNVGDLGLNLGFEDPLDKGMATHSSILTWTKSLQMVTAAMKLKEKGHWKRP